MAEEITYELIDITFELPYELQGGEAQMVREDDPSACDKPSEADAAIEYDADGIPMGNTIEEIRLRQQMIFRFYEDWKITHPEKAVYNKNLDSDILIRKESVVEAAAHASKRYRSTKAIFNLEEILSQATMVSEDAPKPGNKNQEKLSKMLLMSYHSANLGIIKLTVGIRRRSQDKIQYGITALDEGDVITPLVEKNKKKAPHKK